MTIFRVGGIFSAYSPWPTAAPESGTRAGILSETLRLAIKISTQRGPARGDHSISVRLSADPSAGHGVACHLPVGRTQRARSEIFKLSLILSVIVAEYDDDHARLSGLRPGLPQPLGPASTEVGRAAGGRSAECSPRQQFPQQPPTRAGPKAQAVTTQRGPGPPGAQARPRRPGGARGGARPKLTRSDGSDSESRSPGKDLK